MPLPLESDSPGVREAPARPASAQVGDCSITRLSSLYWSSSARSRPLVEAHSPSIPGSTLLFRIRVDQPSLTQPIRPAFAVRCQRHPESAAEPGGGLGNVPSKHAVRTISAAHAFTVLSPIQLHHSARTDEGHEVGDWICGIAR